jgi:hypothetical protein
MEVARVDQALADGAGALVVTARTIAAAGRIGGPGRVEPRSLG